MSLKDRWEKQKETYHFTDTGFKPKYRSSGKEVTEEAREEFRKMVDKKKEK